MVGANWISSVVVITEVSWTSSSTIVAYILPCWSGLARHPKRAHQSTPRLALVLVQHLLQPTRLATANSGTNPTGHVGVVYLPGPVVSEDAGQPFATSPKTRLVV